MPRWIIHIRDEKGIIERIAVRAKTATEAVHLAEIDMDLVYSIKVEKGTGNGKYDLANAIIQLIALLAVVLFFDWLVLRSLGLSAADWTEMNSAGRSTIVVVGALVGLATLVGLGVGLHKFRKQRKRADIAEVLARSSQMNSAIMQFADHPVMRSIGLIMAISTGLVFLSQLGGDRPLEPLDVLMPLFFLWMAGHNSVTEM